jgi:amidase
MTTDLHYLGLLDVSERIRRRELTSEAVTRALLERIERYEGRLNSILLLLAESALADARKADTEIASGFWRGPLHGVPLGVKDLLWMEGLPTTGGMEILKDFRPPTDSTVVKRLKRAGAVIIAKLHMTEAATLAHHPSLPRPVNPWSPPHWTGVSSSGSGVAPAAGFCYGAIGSDTGGSIRMPSSANNLTGIKPTWGRVSRHGLIHLSETFDHLGPMARSAADAAAILQAIAGADPDDPTARPEPVPDYLAEQGRGVSDLVIGVDWEFATGGMPAEITAAVRDAAEVFSSLGAQVREIKFPVGDAAETMAIMARMQAEVSQAHAEHFPEKADRYGPRLRSLLERNAGVDAGAVVRGSQARDRFIGRLRTTFREVDLILTPGLGAILPTWDEIESYGDDIAALGPTLMRFTMPYNATGAPTISLPGGFTADGLPIGIQLAGADLAEPLLVRAGCAFQRVTDFHVRRPPLT